MTNAATRKSVGRPDQANPTNTAKGLSVRSRMASCAFAQSASTASGSSTPASLMLASSSDAGVEHGPRKNWEFRRT